MNMCNNISIKRKKNKKNDTAFIHRFLISFLVFYSITATIFMKFGMEELHSLSESLKDQISSNTFNGINANVNGKQAGNGATPTLTAYIESVDQEEWKVKPLPIRKNAKASKLKKVTYPQLFSCANLPSQWPVDNYPEEDPFLP